MTTYGGTTPCLSCGRALGVGSGSCSNCESKTQNGCFAAGTNVRCVSGEKPIEQIAAGDKVLSLDVTSGKAYLCKVLKCKAYEKTQITTIGFNDGTSVKTTGSHSFFVNNDWKTATQIQPGDAIMCVDDRNHIRDKKVITKQVGAELEPVYNLTTEGVYTFVADGFVAHNFTHFRRTRMLYWQIICLYRRWISWHMGPEIMTEASFNTSEVKM